MYQFGYENRQFSFQTAACGWVRVFSHVKDPNGRTAVFFAKINTFQTHEKGGAGYGSFPY